MAAAAAAGLLLCASSCSSGAKARSSPLSPAGASSSSSEGDGSGFTPPRFVDQRDLPEVEGGARDAGGRVSAGTTVSVDIPPTVSHFDARTARVYLPPAWFASTSRKLPILMLLPGVPGGPTDWTDDGKADLIANDFASHHNGLAPIIVMPDVTGQESGDSECVNSSKYGNAETYLTVDVPTFVRATFRAAAGRGPWQLPACRPAARAPRSWPCAIPGFSRRLHRSRVSLLHVSRRHGCAVGPRAL